MQHDLTLRGPVVSSEPRGVTTFYEHDPNVPRVEIGSTFYGRRFWAGEDNKRSVGAIKRLGALQEGVLRAHRRRHDGTLADTTYISIVREQWPAVRRSLLSRVEPGE